MLNIDKLLQGKNWDLARISIKGVGVLDILSSDCKVERIGDNISITMEKGTFPGSGEPATEVHEFKLEEVIAVAYFRKNRITKVR